MAPLVLDANEQQKDLRSEGPKTTPQLRFVWWSVILCTFIHLSGFYGLYLAITRASLATNIFAIVLYVCSMLGITAGAHRLWSHRSYKAKLPLRILLAFLNCMSFQRDIYNWARNHRVHHKYSETDADPHNAKRGFWFSHVGWTLLEKHPDVLGRGKNIDCSDLMADPVVKYQRKYYLPLMLVSCYVLPTFVPYYFWSESLWTALFVCGSFRHCWTLNVTFLVNSAAHMWGYRPYDKYINPRENMWVSNLVFGEGFHNYHHTFPWDYSTSEFGWRVNLTTFFIDLMALIGQAYDRKTVSPSVIQQRKKKTGENALD